MKTSTFSLYILLLIVAASSCKKDSAGDNASHKVKSYTEDITQIGGRHVETFTVNYDDQGRITTVQSTNRPGHRMVYQYSAENSFTFDKIEDNKVTYHSINFVNSQSLIDSTWWYNNMNDTSASKFIYDADKKLVKQKQYLIKFEYLPYPVLYNSIIYQYDLKGTLVKESDSYYETSYAYDKELKNTVQLEPFYFPFKEQLPSHTYSTRLGTTYETKHTYTFDDHKRVVSEKQERNDGKVIIMSYMYE
jgi:hypothetical protein